MSCPRSASLLVWTSLYNREDTIQYFSHLGGMRGISCLRAEVNVVLNNMMLPVWLVRGFGLVLSHSWCTPRDRIWNHRMKMPFLPSGRTLCVSPIWSYCCSHTDGICAFLVSPSPFPSLCRIWHGWDMGPWWVWFVIPAGQAPGVTAQFADEQDKHQSNNRKQLLSCWNHQNLVWFLLCQGNYSHFHSLNLLSLLGLLSLNVQIC